MPKMKSHSGASKRFKKTGTGKVRRNSSHTSHLFANKSTKQKRKLRKGKLVSSGDLKRIKSLIYNMK
ncbi:MULTISPECIES: 50S ribosomal protein L35 [Planococcaceae]|jgi:large subunit ribosomal protein L35|uniref:Large ribosomal subunit protein bL35 n=3 Tax=Caryophanaceae TaxID=186818 RepID=A0A1C7DJI7_9BACL|nr:MULTISPECIES: 50S ribosomal protein L35 [Planococcaceae]HSP22365.1 50S ribosomal protein L35 [Planococcus sp. (in: firmicutes)]ANU11373.1 50S ribosomal protein L35 [Planococcus antarcticus DSM 14505]EIM05478.1 50S ribosomal protein L35 [Planococcus antarcticus DSM 14505]MBB5180663.1 large subunit ribosomal protein L35 [Planococcus koreensis]MBT2569241.1 50S ribosomal protein L35 [Planococcus sp. ISL-110]